MRVINIGIGSQAFMASVCVLPDTAGQTIVALKARRLFQQMEAFWEGSAAALFFSSRPVVPLTTKVKERN